MDVEARLAVIANGYVPDRTENLALLIDLDLAVVFRSNVEPADGSPLEGADCGQGGRGNPGCIGETGERCKRLLALIQNDDVKARLRAVDCVLIGNFDDGLSYVRSGLADRSADGG